MTTNNETRTSGTMKVVAYCRVSSKEQEKEGFSIAAQQKLIAQYAVCNGMTIVREFVDVETAKRKSPGRREFVTQRHVDRVIR